MATFVKFTLDGMECLAEDGKQLVEAANENGVYIPTLCNYPGVPPKGSCRICTVLVNGIPATACTTRVVEGLKGPDVNPGAGVVSGSPSSRILFAEREPSLPVLREKRKLRTAGSGLPVPDDGPPFPVSLPKARRGGLASQDTEGPQPVRPVQAVHPPGSTTRMVKLFSRSESGATGW